MVMMMSSLVFLLLGAPVLHWSSRLGAMFGAGGWVTVPRRKRGAPVEAQQRLLQLELEAQSIKQSLFGGRAAQVRRPKRPEWTCTTCACTNFDDRTSCRRCQADRGGARAVLPHVQTPAKQTTRTWEAAPMTQAPRLPEASAWQAGPPLTERPAVQAAVLGKLTAAARAAGAQTSVLKSLEQTAADARQRAEAAKKPAQRLADAERKVKRAEAAQRDAWQALAAAKEAAEGAEQAAAQAATELEKLKAVQSQVGDTARDAHSELLLSPDVVQQLRLVLDVVDRVPLAGHEGSGPGLPAACLEALACLRQRLAPPQELGDVGAMLDNGLPDDAEARMEEAVVASEASSVTNACSEAVRDDELMLEI
eukprot:12418749-Karenia_brevis.AAC.1